MGRSLTEVYRVDSEPGIGHKKVLLVDDAVSARNPGSDYGLDILIRDILGKIIDPSINLLVAPTQEEAEELLSTIRFDTIILNHRLTNQDDVPFPDYLDLYAGGGGEGSRLNAKLVDGVFPLNQSTPVIGWSGDMNHKHAVQIFQTPNFLAVHTKPIQDMQQFIADLRRALGG